MFALHLLTFTLVSSAFFLAFFVALDSFTFSRSTFSILLAVAQGEASEKLSAFILDNSPVDVSHELTPVYDVTETPDSTCVFEAGEMLASFLANEAATEKEASTPVIPVVQVKAFTVEDIEIAAGWQTYRRYAALAADFQRVIRPEACYVASENTAFEADIDTSYVDWALATG